MYDRKRAALIACSALAIVVAAALFPAAGYGEYPVPEPAGGQSSPAESDAPTPATEPGDSTEPEDTSTETEPDPETETETETATEPATDTETESETETETASTPDDPSDDESLLPLLGLLFVGGVGALLFRAVTGPRGSGSGSVAGDLPSGFLPRVRFRIGRIPQLTLAATIGVSQTLPAAVDALATGTRHVGAGFAGALSGLGHIGSIAFPSPASIFRSPFAGVSVSGGLSSLVDSLGRSDRRSAAVASGSISRADDPDPDPDVGPKSVEETWEAMVDRLPVRRRRARTPGEYARIAVDVGLPADAVGRLTRAFRDVRYGGHPPSPDLTRRARTAYEEIQRTLDGGDRE